MNLELLAGLGSVLIFSFLFAWNIMLSGRNRLLMQELRYANDLAEAQKEACLQAEAEFQKALEAAKKRPAPTIEAQQILHDMTAHGNAVVRIVPMNPADLFWRAPQ